MGVPPLSQTDEEMCFSEWLEKRLAVFVKRSHHSGATNLYGLLTPLFEKPLIRLALKETQGCLIETARLLGIHRNTLRQKMKAFGIDGSTTQHK